MRATGPASSENWRLPVESSQTISRPVAISSGDILDLLFAVIKDRQLTLPENSYTRSYFGRVLTGSRRKRRRSGRGSDRRGEPQAG